jgi:predicted nucleic acid-binding protein
LERRDTDHEASVAFARLAEARIELRSPDVLYAHAREIAVEMGWAKTYDAEYVALGQLLGCTVVTADERLRRGTARLGGVVGPAEIVAS